MDESIEVSAIVTVGSRYEDTGRLASEYLAALKQSGKSFELIFVLDGERTKIVPNLVELAKPRDPDFSVVEVVRRGGGTDRGIRSREGERDTYIASLLPGRTRSNW